MGGARRLSVGNVMTTDRGKSFPSVLVCVLLGAVTI
jgi:hypothetical protein